jgi:delta1-piperideine-2-carboxylate reductase
MAMTAALPYVAPAGASEAVFGTNPMGFAWPRDGEPPFVFDQASASMARGDVMIAARDGKSVPLGVGVDASGKDTTDPAAIIDGGVQLAFGGYKGASIALMVELLAGPLIGECLSIEAFEHPSKDIGLPFGGEVIIAIDPDALADGDWRGHGEKLLGKLEGMEGVRIAGERRHRNRAKGGAVEVSDQLLQTIAEARAG